MTLEMKLDRLQTSGMLALGALLGKLEPSNSIVVDLSLALFHSGIDSSYVEEILTKNGYGDLVAKREMQKKETVYAMESEGYHK